MDALIFDFDGVIVDSEPIHLKGFQEVFRQHGLELTEEAYYDRYLGFDDFNCALTCAADHGITLTKEQINQLVAEKTVIVQNLLRENANAFPGAIELIKQAGNDGIPIGICSAALRDEIRVSCEVLQVEELVMWITAAEDCKQCKPDPEGYNMTLKKLCELTGQKLRADQTVVVEDSRPGIQAAKAAGTKVLAVTTSHQADELQNADRIVERLDKITLDDLKLLVNT